MTSPTTPTSAVRWPLAEQGSGKTRSVLVVRLDSVGDVLLAGPAVRAVAAGPSRVVLLAGPRGRPAARLLPGVDKVLTWHCPWVDPEPDPVRRADVLRAADMIAAEQADRAVIFTSYHQDPLPTALLLRLAGVPHITAAPEDYPGALLDVRHRLPAGDQGHAGGPHEVERMLSVAAAAGFPPPRDTRLRLTTPLPSAAGVVQGEGYVVVHPGASVPARAPVPELCAGYVTALARDGWRVVVTGSPAEQDLTRRVAGSRGLDLGGRTGLALLASVMAGAAAVVTGNTGPAHLAAAVGTPVVSLFAPTVRLGAWRPWGVPHVVLGGQDAPCAGSRARECPVPGHPCLAAVTASQVTEAVRHLAGNGPAESGARAGTGQDESLKVPDESLGVSA
ncbi:MAG: glycosyltransferase family 9 protein [Actinobacteria bacterium]|nr:glycosyltransferase family 9 protein [Actinomycetota bacterium]